MKRKNLFLRSLSISIAAAICTVASAQYNNSSYFMEGMSYRHQLNPAFAAERAYINAPLFVLGNLNVGMQGNIGVDDFIYPYDGNGYDLTTFMNSAVDADKFLDRLHDRNLLNVSASMPVISMGFNAFGGFNSIEIGAKVNASANLPYELFEFAKLGMSDAALTEYNIRDLNIRTNAYTEIALGHSHRLANDRLAIGAKLKMLIGLANIDANVRSMKLTMGQERWAIEADGAADISLNKATFTYDEDSKIDGIDVDKFGTCGFGTAVDLGFEYDFRDVVPGLKVSAALLDLGFIKWKKGIAANLKSSYTFDGFEEQIVIDADNDDLGKLENQIDKIEDDLKDLFTFEEDKNCKARTTALATTLNAGVEYALPTYRNLKFGLLSSTRINGVHTWSEARLSANIAPVKWFEASVNYAYSTFGSSFGWVINFHPRGFNFFVGTNHTMGKITPQGIPVGDANAHLNVGMNITWGGKSKKDKQEQPVL